MADPARKTPDADVPQGRIKREDADALLMSALVAVSAGIFDDRDRDTALHLVERALPLASASTRMEVFKPIARQMLRAAPARRTPAGAPDWCAACMELDLALSRDALCRAIRLVEV